MKRILWERARLGVLALVLTLLPLLAGCGDEGGTNTAGLIPVAGNNGNAVTALAVAPGNADVAPTKTQQFTATATFADGSTLDVTRSATWTSAAAGTATIDATGLATAVAKGQSTITATLNGVSGTGLLNVVGSSTVTVNHTLLPRAIPGFVNEVRATGTDANGVVQFGPETQPVQVQNVFLNVPINVTSFTLEYLNNGTLVGTFVAAVALTDGGNFVINDPTWTDAPLVANALAFSQQPSNCQVNVAMPQVKVVILDQTGQTLTTATDPVTVSLGNNPGGATLGGTLTVNAVGGIATFNDLTLDQVSQGYQLLAVCNGVQNRISTPFNCQSSDPGNNTGQQFLTIFNQTLPETDGNGSPFPGQANYWDLDEDLDINDGFNDTFDGSNELNLGGIQFPFDQGRAEITWLTPLFTATEGIVGFAVGDNNFNPNPPTGNFCGLLGPASQVSLSQTINLAGAVAPINLSWNDDIDGNSANINPGGFGYQVQVRDAAGALLATAFTDDGNGGGAHNFNLDAFAGQTVMVSFEAQNSGDYGEASVAFDDVSVLDNAATQFVTNGDFETGNLTGWTGTVPPQSQNIVSGTRVVAGLTVQRRFYTQPDQLWGRYLDSYTNNTAAPITTTINYFTNEGSDGSGDHQFVAGTGNQAFSSVDSSNNDRDWGQLFGNATNTDLTTGVSTDDININYDVTVQPGQTIYIVQFVVMSNEQNNRPLVDAQLLDIFQNFRTNPLYMQGLDQTAVLPQIINL